MGATAYSVAFDGVEARLIEVQAAVSAGLPSFAIVGLPDKAVSEARERVRAAFGALAVSLPGRKVTVNLSPADLPKEGTNFDLPIALAVLGAIGMIPPDALSRVVSMGELSLDGRLAPVPGALPAAFAAAEEDRALICPEACGGEAAWVSAVTVLGAPTLKSVLDHLTERRALPRAAPGAPPPVGAAPDMAEVRGQERAKRALEIAAAGRHHLLMIGPPGAGKSMLAARLPGILPELSPTEALDTAIIHSVAGALDHGGISRAAPFRAPHHTASMAALAGGGRGAKPGEISLAHNGVLFLDELPEFSRQALEVMRQPIETGEINVARANAHIRYPARFMLLAAANPCRCGYLADAARACSRAPICGADYLGRISGPLADRFDLRLEVPAVGLDELNLPPTGEPSAAIRTRVSAARARQSARYAAHPGILTNADATPSLLDEFAAPDAEGRDLILSAADRLNLTARGYHRILRTARTIADLAESARIRPNHIAEAIVLRLPFEIGR
ncbi:MAG: YifB family Mg chelatase-like AAA ATPase [Paracoccus sp. (in: a-proteobacteria)]|nr:YifB family Mg chelatase-like AAA ATPase [Paracoccus sp. (in: a-proteobacteria)]